MMGEIVVIPEKNELEIIPNGDVSFINSLPEQFKGLQLGMSGFQIQYGVLSNKEFPTPDSKYWQCVRELFARYDGVLANNYQYLKTKLEIEKLEAEKEMLGNSKIGDIDKRMKELDIAFKKRQLDGMRISCEDTIRQMKKFKELMDEYKKDKKYETKEEAEPEFWSAKSARLQLAGGEKIMQIEDGR
jgi:hypothetical protein